MTAEDILQQSGMSVMKITMLLLRLQLKGFIKETGSAGLLQQDADNINEIYAVFHVV